MNHEDMKNSDCPMCQKGGLCAGLCGQHHWMHIIIKIFVALFIFWCGVQFGELKSAIRTAYYGSGYGMMSSYGDRGQNYFYSQLPSDGSTVRGMMGGWYQAASGTTTKSR